MSSIKQVFDDIISNHAVDYGGEKKFLEVVCERVAYRDWETIGRAHV